MSKIFLSYRSDDSGYATAGIHAVLARRFGAAQVFRDCASMAPGASYPMAIRSALRDCAVVVAVIGPSWLTLTDSAGRRRVDNEHDWVRMELALAFRLGIRVVPVVLDGAVLPSADLLPGDLRPLAYAQAHWVRHTKLDADLADLATRLTPELTAETAATPAGMVQNNRVENGVMFANQGGDQNVYGPPRPGEEMP